MKKQIFNGSFIVLALAVLLGMGTRASAEVRIAFVNTEVILQKYAGTEKALKTLSRDVQAWTEEARRKKRELEELQTELQNEALMLSDDRRREREMAYQQKLTEYDQFIQSVWGPDGLIEQRNEELLRPIVARIQEVLAEIAAEEGYDFVLDAADNNILYANTDYDLTERVLEKLAAEEGQ